MNKFLQEDRCTRGIKFPVVIQQSCSKISKMPTVTLHCLPTGLWLSLRTGFFSIEKMPLFFFLSFELTFKFSIFLFSFMFSSALTLVPDQAFHNFIQPLPFSHVFESAYFTLLPTQWNIFRSTCEVSLSSLKICFFRSVLPSA